MKSPIFVDVAEDKIALRMSESGETRTFGELEVRSNQTAHLYRSLGLRPGDHLAIYLENHLDVFDIVWGAQRSGLIYTLISTRLTAAEAAYIVNDCQAKLFIGSAKLSVSAEIPALLAGSPTLLMVGEVSGPFQSWEDLRAAQPETRIGDETAGTCMLYSSGTTGRPKGVLTELKNERISAVSDYMTFFNQFTGFDQDTVYISPAPLYHAAPLRWSMFIMALGGTVLVMNTFDEREFLSLVERYKVTHGQVVPTMFVRMLKLPEAEREVFDVSSLKCIVHAAAPCPVKVKRDMIDWWGPILFEYYAATEGVGATVITSEEWLDHPGSVGRSVRAPIRIVDEDGAELPVGEVGVVYFENPPEFAYHNDEAKKAESMNERGWATTGDIGYLNEEGYLYLTDRKAFMIISGGVNIYPQEIENALIEHPRLMDVAVFGIPNAEFGEEVKAVVQPLDFSEAGPEFAGELMRWCQERLSRIKCPRTFDFMEQLPRHANGKLYKRELRDPYWADREKSRMS